LVGLGRRVTFALAAVALVVAVAVAVAVPGRTVFWFVIFGWSGIAATFCPTMILSLWWERFTRRGALAAMVTGFVCVPVFKFLAPAIHPAFDALEELVPAFVASALAGIVVSLRDLEGQRRLASVAEALVPPD
jgi:Na+/proline symporter